MHSSRIFKVYTWLSQVSESWELGGHGFSGCSKMFLLKLNFGRM